jgi:hypothetical protein
VCTEKEENMAFFYFFLIFLNKILLCAKGLRKLDAAMQYGAQIGKKNTK